MGLIVIIPNQFFGQRRVNKDFNFKSFNMEVTVIMPNLFLKQRKVNIDFPWALLHHFLSILILLRKWSNIEEKLFHDLSSNATHSTNNELLSLQNGIMVWYAVQSLYGIYCLQDRSGLPYGAPLPSNIVTTNITSLTWLDRQAHLYKYTYDEYIQDKYFNILIKTMNSST